MRNNKNAAKNIAKLASDGELARALDALAWARAGDQLTLPGLDVQRFAGIAPGSDAALDDMPAKVGRPLGSRDVVPAAFRRYLVAKYGSAVEGLSAEANRPLAAIAAEMVQAFQAISLVVGRSGQPTSDQVAAWVTLAANLRQAARRYAAPYQTSPAPAQPAGSGQVSRVAVGLFTGQPAPEEIASGGQSLARILNIEVDQTLSGNQADPPDGESDEPESDE